MKILPTLLTAAIVLTSIGCQSGKHAGTGIAPSPVALSKIYYTVDDSFLTAFGPEGIASVEESIRKAHPQGEIQIIRLEFSK